MTALICPDCQHENEEQRIYCHDCGARLDRSGVVKKQVEAGDKNAQTQKHLKRMLDPGRDRTRRLLTRALQVILGALACAAVILMFLPRQLPPETKNSDFGPMIGMDLVSATSNENAAPLVYSEQEANSYLTSLLRRKGTPGTTGWFPLQRIVVQFEEGRCTVIAQRKIFSGVSVCAATTYSLRLEPRRLIAEPISAFIGHMPIHPALLKGGNPLLQSAWAALARERNSVARLAGIEFHPQSVRLIAHEVGR